MGTPGLEQNPYAPPASAGETEQPDWYLRSACRHLKWIGWAGIVYVACTTAIVLSIDATAKSSPDVGELVAFAAVQAAIASFFGLVTRMAMLLPRDCERLYGRARWLGIIAGAAGFPILTITAYLVVSRLARYRIMTSRERPASEP